MRKIMSLLFVCLFIPAISYGQGKITRQTHQSQTNDHKTSRKVIISEPDGFINGHGYVDLGLPSGTKWATCNVGASNPEEYGEYYAWGEISTKLEYSYKNNFIESLNIKSKNDLRLQGIITIEGVLTPSYDVASTIFNGTWRMPTIEMFQELLDNCKWKWYTIKRKKGFLVIGPNGKNIFLPAAGSFRKNIDGAGKRGHYLCTDGSSFNDYGTRFNKCLSIYNTVAYIDSYDGTSIEGFPVRAVSK